MIIICDISIKTQKLVPTLQPWQHTNVERVMTIFWGVGGRGGGGGRRMRRRRKYFI